MFHDQVPSSFIPSIYRQADLSIIPLKEIPLFAGNYPSKLFETMACKCPFIFCGEGEAKRLIETQNLGACVPPENPEALVFAIRQFVKAPKEFRDEIVDRAHAFVRENFNRSDLSRDYMVLLKSLIN